MLSTKTTQNHDWNSTTFELQHSNNFEQTLDLPTEIDAEFDFGTMYYRVWCGCRCLGTFYKRGDNWYAEAFYNNSSRLLSLHNSPNEAQNVILSAYTGQELIEPGASKLLRSLII